MSNHRWRTMPLTSLSVVMAREVPGVSVKDLATWSAGMWQAAGSLHIASLMAEPAAVCVVVVKVVRISNESFSALLMVKG